MGDISSSDLTFMKVGTKGEMMKIRIEYLHGDEDEVKKNLDKRTSRQPAKGMVHYSTMERTGKRIQKGWTEVEFRMVKLADLSKLLKRDDKQLDKVIDHHEYPTERRELKQFGKNVYELQYDSGNGMFENVKDTMLSILLKYNKADKKKVRQCISTLPQGTFTVKFDDLSELKHVLGSPNRMGFVSCPIKNAPTVRVGRRNLRILKIGGESVQTKDLFEIRRLLTESPGIVTFSTHSGKFDRKNLLKHTVTGEWRKTDEWNRQYAMNNRKWAPTEDSELHSLFGRIDANGNVVFKAKLVSD